MFPAFRKNELMENGRERRALSARGKVRNPKIIYHRDAQFFDEIRRFAELERGRIFVARIMENGLAVQSDELRVAFAPRRMARVKTPEIMMQLAEFPALQIVARGGVQVRSKCFRKIRRPNLAQFHSFFRNRAERKIDAVDAGAGHDAENIHGRILSRASDG